MPNLVKKVRTALGWNQVDFGRAIGRSYPSVRNYERGVEPPPKVLKRIKELANKHGLEELFAPAQPEQSPAPRPKSATSPGSSDENSRWYDLLEEILASDDQETISSVKQSLVVSSKFVRLSRVSRVRKKAG